MYEVKQTALGDCVIELDAIPLHLERHQIYIARKLTSFIDPFPTSCLQLVLTESYQPDIERLIRDYYAHNPTWNRALDMLPLFAMIDEKLVRSLYGDKEKINKRPTFHYRLPNCEIATENWFFGVEYRTWQFVEQLAQDTKAQADSYVLGVQWHPEFMLHRTRHRNPFRELVK